jgi:opacity protein-like surface antigen
LFANRVHESVSTQLQRERSLACNICVNSFSILAALSLLVAQAAHSQEVETPLENKAQVKQPVERDIVFEGLASYGNYQLFATEADTKIYTGGFEYDRHSWGYVLHARMDYVAEFLPVVVFSELADTDYFGNQLSPPSPNRRLLYGVGFSPIGARMMWRDKKAIKPYVLFKGGLLVFDHKAISNHAAYENFSMQSGLGVQTRLTKRVDLRLGLWGDFHFSDGFVVPINPGTDMMNSNLGISYHLGPQEAEAGRRHWYSRF